MIPRLSVMIGGTFSGVRARLPKDLREDFLRLNRRLQFVSLLTMYSVVTLKLGVLLALAIRL
jgi:hypothetical protein